VRLFAGLASLCAVALLAACTTTRVQPPAVGQTWDARRPQLQARASFDLKGRVAVAAGTEGFNARLLWRQTGTRSNVALDGPLGAGGVQITADGPSLSVVTSRGDHLDNEAARSELAMRLGFDPPIGSLRFWVLGVPDPSSPAKETLDSQQRLASLQQDGWQVDYGAYTSVGGEWLPSRLTLQREGVRVRLIVDGWSS
jgi:outer membrane lipoprotein LolB